MVIQRFVQSVEHAWHIHICKHHPQTPTESVCMLENLNPAPRVNIKSDVRPGVEFDGETGTATTPGYDHEPENFDEFLRDAGLDPDGIDVIPPVRTSRWQQQKDGELVWLTSYRFTFRRKAANIDLPLLFAESEKRLSSQKKPKPPAQPERAMVILWSDLQVGKVDYRGNTDSLLERVELTNQRLTDLIQRERPDRIVFCDLGDTVENFYNVNSPQQNYSNDLSIMEQVDVATTMAWRTLRDVHHLVPNVTYASVGSNHCQFRMNGKTIGKPTDDWGIFIGRQLARLAHEQDMNIRFLEPQPHDESLALDVFGDEFHILGVAHGHQAARPDQMGAWWRQQAFGNQPVADANILVHGHFHHMRVTELGSTRRGTSRYLVMAPTMDNGSNWFRMKTGEDAIPGLATFILERGTDFTGTVYKL